MTKEDIQKSINDLVDEAWARMQNEIETELTPENKTEIVEKSDEEETTEEAKVETTTEATAEDETVEKSEEAEEETTEKSEVTTEESTDEETVEKGKKEQESKNLKANGGKDDYKSGTPKCDKQQMMRKSEDELSAVLTEDELEVVKAWREEIGAEITAEETVAKSQGGLTDTADIATAIKAAVAEATADIAKSLNDKDEVIKSMNEKIEKMASAPAYDKRSVDSLEVIEKGNGDAPSLNKSQVLDTMLDLQKAGKGVTSHHVAEFEATGNISNPNIANLVKTACKQ